MAARGSRAEESGWRRTPLCNADLFTAFLFSRLPHPVRRGAFPTALAASLALGRTGFHADLRVLRSGGGTPFARPVLRRLRGIRLVISSNRPPGPRHLRQGGRE